MNLFNLVAKLSLDSSEYDRAMAAAKGTAVSSGNSMVASIGKAKKAIGAAALGMGAAIGAFGVASVKTGMEFDSAMSQVAATMGMTMDEMSAKTGEVDLAWGHFSGNLRDYAKEMGAHTKFSATESAEALNYMALAGYDAQKSMEMLPPVLNLAAAGNMDLATASDMVTDASSALSLSQAETVAMVDQMAAASAKSNTSVEQLGSAMLTVGGTAKVLKGGTTELSTALGILADNGTKGAEGGTALRNILTSIQGDKFEDTFGEMGVQAYDAQGKLRSLKDIFGDMSVALDGLTDEQKTDIINKTFNARDLKNVNALLGTSADRWNELGAAIEDSEGAAQQMADTQLDNLAGDITLLQSAFEGLKIQVSEGLTPTFRTLVQGLTWCIDHANILGPIILGLATAFGVFAVAINIGTIIQTVTTAFAALNAVLLANPIGIVIAIIAGLVVAFITLWKTNEDFRNKVKAIWNSVKSIISSVVNSIKSKVTSTFNAIKAVASAIWNGVKNNIVTPIKSAYNSVRTTFDNIKNTMQQKMQAAKDKVRSIIDGIKNLFPFNVGKIFTGWVPKIKLTTSKSGDSASTNTSVGQDRFAKAMNQPYMFRRPTEFYAGEAGDEMLYGKTALINDIETAMARSTAGGMDIDRLGQMLGEIAGDKMAEAIEGMEIVLDRRSFGKMTRRLVNA